MQYLACPACGFANELIETNCTRCGNPLDAAHPVDSSTIAEAQRAYAAAAAPTLPAAPSQGTRVAGAMFNAVMQPLANLAGEYPWAHRFISYVRVVAKILYVLGILQCVFLLLAGIVTSIGAAGHSGGFLSGTAAIVGGILLSVIAAVLTYLLVWLGYMFLMALPDFLECVLRIETNTRPA